MLCLANCRETIIHNLSENDANRFLTKLNQSSIEASKDKQSDGMWSISVNKEDSMKALKKLDDSRLLKAVAYASNERSSLISSKEDQKFYFERSLSAEIEKTILSIEGVLEARVHLNIPVTDPILGNRLANSKGSGSVLLIVRDKFSMEPEALSQLVSGAAGIEKSQISVLISKEVEDVIETAIEKENSTLISLPQDDVVKPEQIQEKEKILPDFKIYQLFISILAIALFFIGVRMLTRREKWRNYEFNRELEAIHSEEIDAVGSSVRH